MAAATENPGRSRLFLGKCGRDLSVPKSGRNSGRRSPACCVPHACGLDQLPVEVEAIDDAIGPINDLAELWVSIFGNNARPASGCCCKMSVCRINSYPKEL